MPVTRYCIHFTEDDAYETLTRTSRNKGVKTLTELNEPENVICPRAYAPPLPARDSNKISERNSLPTGKPDGARPPAGMAPNVTAVILVIPKPLKCCPHAIAANLGVFPGFGIS